MAKSKESDIKLSDLIPDDKNFNKGSEYGNGLIEKSFSKFGAGRSILIDKNNRIIAGNKSVENAMSIGLDDVQIVESDGKRIIAVKRMDIDLDTPQGREMALADNASAKANIVFDAELIEAELGEATAVEWGIEVADKLEAEEDDFDVPDVGLETDIVLGDLFEIGEHRLLCGDSTCSDTVAKLMNGEKADMVFTDPPYNIDYQGVKDKRDKIANDKMSDEDFTQFLYDALNINCDTFYVCCSWQYSHLFRKSLEDLQKPVKSFIVWDKINPAQHLDKYFKQHEIILYHGKFGGQKTLRGDVWQTKRQRNTVHPTMKPIEIIEMALNDNTDKKNIYDAFLGSGSTMVASHQMKRKCYGMELDPKYCQVIVDRMIKLDPSLEIKKNGVKYEHTTEA
jgi:site-specific DNA-methyltransferase (adenine-specific)